ncbi:hypothetical protein G3N56_14560 [Desulfovibrio sulfodismutans]|uniref:Glycosyltransferase n=1 Tax=Desulfolutivibrio sulfodismutans TaxID=63561 RepID=A0A7K3NQ98_9BACT|nr:glycoside hydrolase family 99-like domain-containing protein [Desulfolutivibrio sulfodismutans]NDY57955.1 hypothetical protein [Desulfolutivibrio sulfodismutans]QLA14625.1 hypothetical protein GD606_19960 [Desulfolutivibrio sulfodismutans DSM 3696]
MRKKTGLSIVVVSQNTEDFIPGLLAIVSEIKNQHPVECIIIDNCKSQEITPVIDEYCKKIFIRYIVSTQQKQLPEQLDFWAKKAKHPFLLLLYHPIAITAEVLCQALDRLSSTTDAGAVVLSNGHVDLLDGFILVDRLLFQTLDGMGKPKPGANLAMEFSRRLTERLAKPCITLEVDHPSRPGSIQDVVQAPEKPKELAPITAKVNVSKNNNIQPLLEDHKILLDFLVFLNEKNSDLSAVTEEILYGMQYPDVKSAVSRGEFSSCKSHFERYGKNEGRLYYLPSILKKFTKIYSKVKNSIVIEENLEEAGYDSGKFNIIPFYVSDTIEEHALHCVKYKSICVHAHLFYQDMLPIIIDKLKNIPLPFDIFVSVPKEVDNIGIANRLRHELDLAKNIVVETVTNKGRDVAPFIVQFGKRILTYDYVLHIHTKQSLHNTTLKSWGMDIFDLLLGSKVAVSQILVLLHDRAKIVYPAEQNVYLKNPTGWDGNYTLARDLLDRFTNIDINEFPAVEFAEGSMIWARTSALAEFLSLPLTWDDFPEEPIPADGTLAHALERLLFVLSFDTPGDYFKLCKRDSINDFRFYEEQQDYSQSLVHTDIKVLAYYLPQFHPIPENDAWHGKGFTEWTKVKSATPLFAGHYQQHIPHSDIGYYLLDNPDILRKQADMMRKSGVHGLIFYHYWFTGKLILEEPATMLLQNPDIDIPFCFCWANENWTKCWDGNEKDILLEQKYSDEDAAMFIEYLIQFFKDPRYMKIDDRPVLYIYRPSSITDVKSYLRIWKEHCIQAGLKAPYVVAVLTRGAASPNEYGMDAGVERVLNDWGNGNIPECKNLLNSYYTLEGSVLNYNDVANYYMNQIPDMDFTYFRSLVPNFDNTARYAAKAILTHQVSPAKFQEWFERLITYAQTLPSDRQYIIVNAWNEWAEGAHLEPDTRFGYGFLNAIGRGLSKQPYANKELPDVTIAPQTTLHLEIPEFIEQALVDDSFFKRKFLHTLGQATVFGRCVVTAKQSIVTALRSIFPNCPVLPSEKPGNTALVVQFRKPAFLASDCLENMLRSATYHRDSIILSNYYDSSLNLTPIEKNGSVGTLAAYDNALALLPPTRNGNIKLCTQARTFVTQCTVTPEAELPEVTTIVRIHPGYSLISLRNALLSLLAMHSCVVKPFLAVQNFTSEMRKDLEDLLNTIFSSQKYYHIEYFNDAVLTDLRTRMLNESIKMAKTPYVGYLDFDDLLMNDAYHYLISQLKRSKRSVAFGRVFLTNYYNQTQELVARNKTYEYGFSYSDFITNNCFPLHSFIIDKTNLDFTSVKYHDKMVFMEDYYFLMQILTRDNAHWEGLRENHYIGDYIHSLDYTHSLACADENERNKIINSDIFKWCTQRLEDLRVELQTKN